MLSQLCTCLYFLLTIHTVSTRVEQLHHLPEALQHNFDVYQQMTNLDTQPGKLIFWGSLQHYVSQFIQRNKSMTPEEEDFFQKHVDMFMEPIYAGKNTTRVKRQARARGRPRRPPIRPRIRKEIRMLTIDERRAYFRALNVMKRDRRLRPNVYDCFADFHQGENIGRAHFGPAFPAWHRLYLWLFESFLRMYDATVTIPYWASTIDNDMEQSTQSVIWSEGFYGTGRGGPSGPFRTWPRLSPSHVFTRDIGNGPLYTYDDIAAILSKQSNWQLLIPTADQDSNFEFMHGGPHTYVSGSMNNLNEAVRDPIFYSHHCFVDYIWELFRRQQRRTPGVNPQEDYPFIANDTRFDVQHSPNNRTGFFPRRQVNFDYLMRHGYSSRFFFLVRYEDIPVCPRCGDSAYLFCNESLPFPRCVSRTRADLGGGFYTNDLFTNDTTPMTDPNPDPCPPRSIIRDSGSQAAQTGSAYIPVRIISKRPPTYNQFKDYSLYTYGRSSRTPIPLSKTDLLLPGTQKGYQKCMERGDTVSKIKIITYGLNYQGVTEEEAVIDNRLGVSQSTGFAVVRAPTPGNPTEAMVAAFDSCGCVCRPFCVKGMNSSSTSKFTGGFRVTTERPLQYGLSHAEAILGTWDIPRDAESPEMDSTNIPLTFYCDYDNDWIWQGPSSVNLESYRNITNRRSSTPAGSGTVQQGGIDQPFGGFSPPAGAIDPSQIEGLSQIGDLSPFNTLGQQPVDQAGVNQAPSSGAVPDLQQLPHTSGVNHAGKTAQMGGNLIDPHAHGGHSKGSNSGPMTKAERRQMNRERKRLRQERKRARSERRGNTASGLDNSVRLANYRGRSEQGCVLSTTCTLSEPCPGCTDRQIARCQKTSQYAVCSNGRYRLTEYTGRRA